MSQLPIVYQFSKEYAPFAAASIASLLKSRAADDEILLFLLTEEPEGEDARRIARFAAEQGARPVIVPTGELLRRVEALGIPAYRGSHIANLELFFPDWVDPSLDRLLYIDADTVVCSSLAELVYADLHGAVLGMVRDSMAAAYPALLGLAPEECYCNSGMVLFDLPTWRACKGSQQVAEHVKTVRASYVAPDQDLLNMVFRGRIAPLSPRWNLQPWHLACPDEAFFRVKRAQPYYTRAELEAARQDPAILHCYRYLGDFPWNTGNLHPFRAEFEKALAASPYAGYTGKPSGRGALFALEKLLYRTLPRGAFFRLLAAQQRRMLERGEMALREAR